MFDDDDRQTAFPFLDGSLASYQRTVERSRRDGDDYGRELRELYMRDAALAEGRRRQR